MTTRVLTPEQKLKKNINQRKFVAKQNKEANNHCKYCGILIKPKSKRCVLCCSIKRRKKRKSRGSETNHKYYIAHKKNKNKRCVKCNKLVSPTSVLCSSCFGDVRKTQLLNKEEVIAKMKLKRPNCSLEFHKHNSICEVCSVKQSCCKFWMKVKKKQRVDL